AMDLWGGVGTLLCIMVLAAVAAAAFGGFRPRRLLAPATLAAAAFVVAGLAPRLFAVQPSPQKFLPFVLQATGARVEETYWNALGRVDVLTAGERDEAPPLGAFRGMSRSFPGPFPEVKWITIDGGAETPIVRFDGDFGKLAFLEYYLPALAYEVTSPAEVLIVGAGGGIDVLAALKHGARRVEAVELNPAIVAVDERHYADYNGELFGRPEVELFAAEGRSFVRASDRQYDLIQLSLVDTFTASASGAHALSENYLYTVEAFRDYYRHLCPGGVVTVTRNYFTFGHESLRLVVLAYEALAAEGERRPEDCLAVFTNNLQANVLARRGGFSPADVERLEAAAAGKYRPLWLPGKPVPATLFGRVYRNWHGHARLFLKPQPFGAEEGSELDREAAASGYRLLYSSAFLRGWNEFSAFLQAKDKGRFFRRYFYDVRPTTDDRPFYFLTSKWRNLYTSASVAASPGLLDGTNFVDVPHAAQFFILYALAEAVVLSVVFIVAPVYFFRRRKLRLPRKWSFAVYFLLLGGGFMLIEIPLIQKFTLYLGHPVYAFAAALATLLAASGAGSLASVRFRGRRWVPFGAIVVLAVLFTAGADAVLGVTLGWPLAARLGVAVASLAPLGFFLGMPFPLGIGVAAAREATLIPWAWAANGCASVAGPTAAVLLAATQGHNVVLLAAAVVYLIALGAIYRAAGASTSRKSRNP
ncbi:MAG: hypothetical protein JSU81_00660, partial [Candidatus Coatesbacteria bacterium]